MTRGIEGDEVSVRTAHEPGTVHLSGDLTIRTVTPLYSQLSGLDADPVHRLDLSGVTRLDTAGAWALVKFQRSRSTDAVDITCASAEAESLLRTVQNALPQPEAPPQSDTSFKAWLDRFGRRIYAGMMFLRALTGYLGIFLHRLARAVRHPSEFKLTSLVHHCEEVGVKAVPIVALMAFLIGVVLAFQGSTQLRQFGAEVFVVDLIAISILRELGILLTAIIVAGRTASAFTAAIGSMKMREEIDALRVMGLNPVDVLVVPRILALIIAMPILTFLASMAGLFGAGLTAWFYGGIAPETFVARLQSVINYRHFSVGLIKAPFMAIVIGAIACIEGMNVKGSAESLGQQVTASVVKAIFMVIVVDGLFAMFFASIRF